MHNYLNIIKQSFSEKQFWGLWSTLILPIVFFQTSSFFLIDNYVSDKTFDTYTVAIALIALCVIAITFISNKDHLHYQISPSALIFLIVLLFIWLLGMISSTQAVAQLAIVLMLFFSLCYFYGYKSFLYSYTGIGLLITVTPIWGVLNTPLRTIGSIASNALLGATGFHSVRDGFYIQIPEGIFFVDKGCAGTQQLFVAMAVALLYSWHTKLNLTRTAIAFICAALVAVLANIIRIYIIIIFGHMTDMQHYFITVEHVSLGWAVFAVAIFIYFHFAARFIEKPQAPKEKKKVISKAYSKITLALPLCLCILFSIYLLVISLPKQTLEGHSLALDARYTQLDYRNNTQPVVNGAQQEFHTTIRHADQPIDIHIYFFNQQKQGLEAINSENKVAPDNWSIAGKNKFEDSHNIYFLQNQLKQQYIAIQAYWINGEFSNNNYKSKLINGLQTLKGNSHIAYVVIGTEYDNSNILQSFVDTHMDNINHMLSSYSKRVSLGK